MLKAGVQRMLLLGSQGQLGHQLSAAFAKANWQVKALSRHDLDLANPDREAIISQWDRLLELHEPDWIVNAAAYTAVDRAEKESELAMQVNAWFPGIMGQRSKGARLVHFSTDYVFDGQLDRPYQESDQPAPLNVYGLSKWRGEQALLEAQERALVIRTSWVVGAHGQNFVKTILRLACEQDNLKVVSDQWGVPTPTSFLAEQLALVLSEHTRPITQAGDEAQAEPKQGDSHDLVQSWTTSSQSVNVHRRSGPNSTYGIYHLTPSGQTNWYAYAIHIIEQARNYPSWANAIRIRTNHLSAVPSSAYPVDAKRPQNSRLDCMRWRIATGQSVLLPWEQALIPVLKAIFEAEPPASPM